jgi:hypothetical protein
MGRIEHLYAESFRSFAMDLLLPLPDDDPFPDDAAGLLDWFHRRDSEPEEALHIYREGVLIFFGKGDIYPRAMEKDCPRRWRQWVG